MKKQRTWTKWLYWFTFAVAVIIVYKTLDNFSEIRNFLGNIFSVLMPFVFGILLAYLFYIPCRKVESIYHKAKWKWMKKIARKLSVLTVYLIAFLIIVIIFNFILPTVSRSVMELVNQLPNYYNYVMQMAENIPENSILSYIPVEEIIENLKNIDFRQFLSMENITNYLKGAFGIVNGIFTTFVTIIVSIYILLERTQILLFLKKLSNALFKRKASKNIGQYFAKSNEIFFKFIYSQVLDGIIVGIITSIAMLIMGVKYAVLLGFMIGLFNIIPYFGAIIAVVIAGIITWITGGLGQAIWMVVIVTILQQIDANIINPKIVGNSLKISPLLVIFAVTVGGAYFGFLGMFLAVPVIAIIKILVEDSIDYANEKEISQIEK